MKKFFTIVSLVSAIVLPAQDLTARGVVEALEQTVLFSEIAGKITSLSKNEGEDFNKNDVLVRIDCAIYEAQLQKTQTQADIAKQKMLKNEELLAYNSMSKFELEISKKEYEKEKAELDIAKINTQRCTVYAPYNGKVVTKLAQRYQNVQPNQELLEIVKTSEFEFKVIVPASWLTFLKKNQKFSLLVDETGKEIQATIKELGAVIDTSSQTITLRAKPLKPYGLLIPGMSATAYFNNTQN